MGMDEKLSSGTVSFWTGAAMPHAGSDDEPILASAIATISAQIPPSVVAWAEHHVHEKIRDEFEHSISL